MLTPWGSLPKAQDDAQTINEAITAAISVHESDPTAHLGAGESLEQHKINGIIDHPASSIVPDKFSISQTFLFLNVIPPDSNFQDNLNAYNSPPFLQLYQNTAFSGNGYYNIANFIPSDLGYDLGEAIMDFLINGGGGAGTWVGEFSFTWGLVEFKEGYYRIGYFNGSWNYSSWVSITQDIAVRFRFHYVPADGKVYVYLRENQVYEYNYDMESGFDEIVIFGRVNRGTSTVARVYLANINLYMSGI